MREFFDALCKDSLVALLDDVGAVTRGLEVTASAQRFDLWFAPDPARLGELHARGVLGALVDGPDGCGLEPFRNTPDHGEVEDCLRKLLARRRDLNRAPGGPRDGAASGARRPWSKAQAIVLSPGVPFDAITSYGMLPSPRWTGVYTATPGIGLVVAMSELAITRDTLALRLLAKGPTAVHALRELGALPPDAWEFRFVEVLLRWQRQRSLDPTPPADEETEYMTATAQTFAEMIREQRQQGIEQGIEAGERIALTRLFARRLRRPLTEGERAVLDARLRALGHDVVSDAVLDLDDTALATWLTVSGDS